MNLLFTLTAYPPFLGGAQVLAHRLARELLARHQVQVVTQLSQRTTDWLLATTLCAPSPCEYEHEGVRVARITVPGASRPRLAPWVLGYFLAQRHSIPRIASVLAGEIDRFSRDATLVHNTRIGREGLTWASWQVAARRGIPFVLTPVHHPRWDRWPHRIYHDLYRRADAVIAMTEAERRSMVRLGVKENRVFVTGTGPDLAPTANALGFRKRFGLSADPMVLFVGQKYRYKGIAALLGGASRVWKKFPETRFVFIGPRTDHSRKLFAGVHDERVLELDTVDLATKTDAFAACDMFCLPSSQESFGVVFTEAWTFGRPVIGCDIPAVREVITSGQDGFVVAQRSDEIADRILFLLDNPAERQRLGENGRKKVQERYTWPALARRTEEIYEKVLSGREP